MESQVFWNFSISLCPGLPYVENGGGYNDGVERDLDFHCELGLSLSQKASVAL